MRFDKGVVTYDDIGRMAFTCYKADIERFNTKNQRRIARSDHECEGESYVSEIDEVRPLRCHLSNYPVEDWCDNCKYVQPYHEAYIEAAKTARVAKWKLTRFCKQRLWNEGTN